MKTPEAFFGICSQVQGDLAVGFIDRSGYPLPSGNKLASSQLVKELKILEPNNVLLFEDVFRTAGIGEGSMGAVACIGEIDDFARTRQDSANAVYFGQLAVSMHHPGDSDVRTELVAIKPLTNPTEAAHEFGAMTWINESIGGQGKRPDTFRVLGFFKQNDGTTAMISRYEQNVISLDNIFNKEFGKSRVERFLGYCAATLGFLHVNGGVHGDAQIKNIAIDGEGVRIIDLTYFQRFDPTIPELNIKYNIEDDLRTIVGSLGRYGVEGEVVSTMLGNYWDFITHPNSQLAELNRPDIDLVV